jgi:predicted Holliday junction resolvase-like endonuclease
VPVDSGILTAVLSSAGAGTAIIVVLLLTGILVTKSYLERVEHEAEKQARETERHANDELRATALVQSQRADAAVETAKLAQALLEDIRKRTADAPHS